ncbi:MAG: hypothetical protein HC781_22315 [Leptolyngbyaceae cyanobacterium CSU_1_4]|nr:hypothetical protein [Leptolyngbyaceae cyanobacterium CSU_1_4]
MAGEFDNQPQARDQPAWFVHLRLWYRPLPMRIEGNLAFFAEQANALTPDRPYRQRIAVLTEASGTLQVQYLAFKQPEKFLGAGANPGLLKSLSLEDLENLPGCRLNVSEEAGKFKATPQPGEPCYFQYNGATRQVVLGFEVSAGKFWSYDRGVDPETGQGLWGALMGAYEFHQCEVFARELIL